MILFFFSFSKILFLDEERGHFILVFDVMRGGFDGGDYFVVSLYTRTVGERQVS